MNRIRQLMKRLNNAWIDSSEEHYIHIWISLIVLVVGCVLVYMLFSQANRIETLKKENVYLTHQITSTTAELNSIKAQLEFNASPVISQEAKAIDIVIQSNAQEIKGKVNEIQKQLIEGSPASVAAAPKTTPNAGVRQLNNSLQEAFCKSNPAHNTCKGDR